TCNVAMLSVLDAIPIYNHGFSGFQFDLMGDVVSGGSWYGQGGGSGEAELLGLGDRLPAIEHIILGKGAVAFCGQPQDLITDCEVFDLVTDGGDNAGGLPTHGRGQIPVITQRAGPEF